MRVGVTFGVVAAVAVIGWQMWPNDDGSHDPNDTDANLPGSPAARGVGGEKGAPPDANTASPPDGGATSRPLDPPNGKILALQQLSAAEAMALWKQGNDLLARKRHAEGRTALTKALLSGRLPTAAERTAREALDELAGRMIFSRDIFDADPYVTLYTFQKGEVLAKIERKLKLHVPTQILLKINGVRSARTIRAGQTLKLIRGPFHAVVSKSHFTMDIYLHREGCEPAYVRRLKVGLGKNGSTPMGLWRVALGRKLVRAPWNPPPNAEIQRSIAWGEPDYPLGTKGYWLGLEGIDGNTRLHDGYGIHGTNHPESIGRAESLGCIRLADPDIETVFWLLYEHWSTVRVRP